MEHDDYLWDRSGEPDPEVRRLEELLGTLRSERPAPELPAGAVRASPSRLPVVLPALAASLVLVLAGTAWLAARRPERPEAGWEVARVEGAPRVGAVPLGGTGRLVEGEWLETDAASRARLSLPRLGRVEVEPRTRLRLSAARADEQRLTLERGAIRAVIAAPPRLFLVETPSALAVDLGCAYTLEVDAAGAGWLTVTAGWVALEGRGRESFVPAGARCAARPGAGPGTPHFQDAPAPLVRALESLESSDGTGAPGVSREAALDALLAAARPRDALTLWHLLARPGGGERGRVFDRMAALAPPPGGVTRDGILAGDRRMLGLWWRSLGLGGSSWLDLLGWTRPGPWARSVAWPTVAAGIVMPGLALAGPTLAAPAGRAAPRRADENLPARVVVATPEEPGTPLVVSGRIYGPDGSTPATGVILDFYHTDAQGRYNRGGVEEPRLKGRLRTGPDGRYEFRTIRPASYPGGSTLAHIHAQVIAPGRTGRWIPDYLFDDDPLLKPEARSRHAAEGSFSPILKTVKDAEGILRATRDIRLEAR